MKQAIKILWWWWWWGCLKEGGREVGIISVPENRNYKFFWKSNKIIFPQNFFNLYWEGVHITSSQV
jgi:hypothetical protein